MKHYQGLEAKATAQQVKLFHSTFFYFLSKENATCLRKWTFSHNVKAYVQYNSLNALNLVHAAKMS